MGVGQAQAARQRAHEGLGMRARVGVAFALVGEPLRVAPAGLAVGAPADGQRPARQLLAGVPLALAKVQEAALAVLVAQLVDKLLGIDALGGAQRLGVPFRRVAVVDGDEGGLAAHRQPHVAGREFAVHLLAELQHVGPLFVVVGLGHARRLVDARDAHLVVELHLALVDTAADGRCAARRGRGRQRDMAFAGHQSRGGVQADPAGARQVDLAPGVQVGEVDLGAARAIKRLLVGGQLDQIARHEARRQAQVAGQLHQQPAGVAAGAGGLFQRLLGRLHAGLEADQVGHAVLHALVQLDEEVDRRALGARDVGQIGRQQRRRRLDLQVGRQLDLLGLVVGEREGLRVRLEEEVEGVVDRHLGHQVHGDGELGRLLGEDQAREVVGERVLLPVDEVVGGLDAQRIRQHRRAAVRRRAQPHDLRAQANWAVVFVAGDVLEGDVDAHVSCP